MVLKFCRINHKKAFTMYDTQLVSTNLFNKTNAETSQYSEQKACTKSITLPKIKEVKSKIIPKVYCKNILYKSIKSYNCLSVLIR